MFHMGVVLLPSLLSSHATPSLMPYRKADYNFGSMHWQGKQNCTPLCFVAAQCIFPRTAHDNEAKSQVHANTCK
jgi:hypothetical protein